MTDLNALQQDEKVKLQESRIKNQESRIKNQESRIKNQESRIKNQDKRSNLNSLLFYLGSNIYRTLTLNSENRK